MSIRNNNVFLIGNLGKEAEIRETTTGTVANFRLAVYRSGRGNDTVTDWINVVCWHDLARGMATIEKGTKLIVIGSLNTRSYEVNDERRYVTEVLAREIGTSIAIKEDKEEIEEEIPF